MAMLSTTLVGWLINASMAYVTDCAHASPQIFALVTRSRKLRSPSMVGATTVSAVVSAGPQRSATAQDRAVRRDIGVVATLS